jgi:hypothetical protein
MKPAFLVTSAINTRFGVYPTATRLQQTVDTISSIRARCDYAHITLIEMAGEPLQDTHKDVLLGLVDVLFDFSADATVKEIYKGDSSDIVKNLTEISCFGQTLALIENLLKEKHSDYAGVDRFFKLSGRYLLNDDFKLSDYNERRDKIVFAQRRNSQFDRELTGGATSHQYMSRCWSFPVGDLSSISRQYEAMHKRMVDMLKKGEYLDIEHLLYLYTDPSKVLEVDRIGVEGLLGPSGALVRD